MQTRWKDNDCYGHMNNAVYHAIYDSIINIFLIRHCGLSIDKASSSVVGFMVKIYFNSFLVVLDNYFCSMKHILFVDCFNFLGQN